MNAMRNFLIKCWFPLYMSLLIVVAGLAVANEPVKKLEREQESLSTPSVVEEKRSYVYTPESRGELIKFYEYYRNGDSIYVYSDSVLRYTFPGNIKTIDISLYIAQ